MGTQIGNGHTGTEHMTAARWQAVFKSLWGADNVVFKTGSELAITVTPGTGTVTIADGVFSFNGVLGTVETSDSATYVKPASEGAYAKIGVAIKYTKNSETLVESLDVVCLKSTETTSVELAQALTIDYGDDTIDGATTEAYYPLYEFIVNSIEDSNTETLFETVDTLPVALEAVATMQPIVAALNPVLIKYSSDISGSTPITLTSAETAGYEYLIFKTPGGYLKTTTLAFKSSGSVNLVLGGDSAKYLVLGGTTSSRTIKLEPSNLSGEIWIYGVNAP